MLHKTHSTSWFLGGIISPRLKILSSFSADSSCKATGSPCGSTWGWEENLHQALTVARSTGEWWARVSSSAEVPGCRGAAEADGATEESLR